ncbi:MAG: thioredoxin [Symploca sp. SIO3E6]|nr:thioredoxin [Caldora sp. SIO3E6]
MTANPIDLTTESFKSEVIESTDPVLVDFFAPWCGPCRVMNPLVATIAQDYAGVLKVAKLNVDDAPAIASQYKITAIPSLLVFRNGEVIEHLPGLISQAKLKERLQSLGLAPTALV